MIDIDWWVRWVSEWVSNSAILFSLAIQQIVLSVRLVVYRRVYRALAWVGYKSTRDKVKWLSHRSGLRPVHHQIRHYASAFYGHVKCAITMECQCTDTLWPILFHGIYNVDITSIFTMTSLVRRHYLAWRHRTDVISGYLLNVLLHDMRSVTRCHPLVKSMF